MIIVVIIFLLRLFCRRNVRLKKGFVNMERAPFGGLKLRIPTLLYVEKMRTQSRFNVRTVSLELRTQSRTQSRFNVRACDCIALLEFPVLKRARPQLMRMEATQQDPAHPKDRKPVHNASSKVSLVVQRMLFPMLDSPMRTHVLLDTDAEQMELDLLDQVGRTRPELLEDQQTFVQHLLSLVERYSKSSGYARVSTCAD